MLIHDNPAGALGYILIAILIFVIGFFIITTIHDFSREERIESILKSLEGKDELSQ